MKNKLKELEKAKILLNTLGDEFELFTYNKKTEIQGVAFFCNDGGIKVFEGNGDGSDDKVMDYETFINNYLFFIAHEIEQIPFIIRL